jgi:signal transduction histidine kinase
MTASSQLLFELVEGRWHNLPEDLFRELSLGVAILDSDFVLRNYNETWSELLCRYTTLSASQLKLGVVWFDLLPETVPEFKPMLEQAHRGQTLRRESVRLETKAGVSYWDIVVTPRLEMDEDEIIVAMFDVTERALAYQELAGQAKAHAHGLTTLLEISHSMISLDQEPLLYLILDRLRDIEDYTEAGITRLDNDQVTVSAYRGFVPQEAWVGWTISVPDSPIHRQVIYQRQPVIIPDIWSDSLMAQTLQDVLGEKDLDNAYEALRSWMAVPLMVKEQVIGMLFLGHRQPNRFSNQRAEMVQALADHVAVALEIDRLSRLGWSVATLEERDWLARELHDNVAQALGYMNLQLTSINSLLADNQIEEAQTGLRELKHIVGDTYTDVREEIFNLRATTSAGLGFMDTLRDYLTRYETHYELDVELVLDVDEKMLIFPAEVSAQVIRIIQEALINVRKHAGVRQAILRFKQVDHHICISVEDQGKGFTPTQPDHADENGAGFGLQIMAERVEGVGGYLEVDAAPGKGVNVMIWLPLNYGK